MEPNLHNTIISFIFTISVLSSKSHSRDLRPSEHGLPYPSSTTPTTKSNDPQLHSFFAGAGRNTPPLPEARNVTTWWNNNNNNTDKENDGMSRDGRRDHVREVLLVSSLVCGAAGVILLVVSVVIFVVRLRKKKQTETSLSTLGSTSVPNVVNK